MRTVIALLLAVAGCARSDGGKVDEAAVVSYLEKAPAAEQNRILSKAGVAAEPAAVEPGSPGAGAPPERTDLIARGDKPLTLVGRTPEVGDPAPAFTLVGADMQPVTLEQFRGKTLLLSVVPSIDTRICELQTHRITDERPKLPDGVAVLTVSRDLPFAQTRFVESIQVDTPMASDYKGGGFGRDWGLEVKETGLLARSLWVIGPDGKVAYRQLVDQQGSEPAYEPALAAARAAAGEPAP
jgi:thiol peroxidase